MMFIGIDGGGTRTRALAVTAAGTLIGPLVDEASNIHNRGLGSAVPQLAQLVDTLAREAPDGSAPIYSAACIAGVDTAGVRADLQRELQRARPGVHWRVENDALAAWKGAFGDAERGVVVISGTGAIALARSAHGTARAGAWGPVLDDRGSAWDVGRRALTAVLEAYDGSSERTALTDAVLSRLGLASPEQIVDCVHLQMRIPEDVAGLAPLVLDVAAAGDAVAGSIVRAAATELIRIARGAAARLRNADATPLGFGLVGGLGFNPTYRSEVRRLVGHTGDQFVWHEPLAPPIAGAVVLASEMTGLEARPAGFWRVLSRVAAGGST